MFKIHPTVPECMSDQAKAFIMRCFEPNPDHRATAAELLMDPFLRPSPRKKNKVQQESEPDDSAHACKDLVYTLYYFFLRLLICITFCLLFK